MSTRLQTKVDCPAAKIKTPGFSESKLALYEDRIEAKVYLKKEDNKSANKCDMIPIQLKLQAYNGELCLPPEVLNFNISPVIVRH